MKFFAGRQRVVLSVSVVLALIGIVAGFTRSDDGGTTSLSSDGTTTSTTEADGALFEETTTTPSTTATTVPATTTTVKVALPTTTAPKLRGFGAEGWIVYDISGEEHLVAPDGSGDYILNTGITEPAWSPDHSTIVFAPHAQRPAWHYVRSDGVLHKFNDDQGHHRWPAFAADGAHVFVASYTNGATAPWTVHVLALDGGEDRTIHGQTDEISQVAAAPDGTTVAFISNGQVKLMNPDGSNVRVAPGSPQGAFWLDWTNDSQSVLYAYQNDIWRLDVHSGALTQITNTSSQESNPQVSPDGTRLAVNVGGGRGIDVMKLDGSDRRHIVDAPVYEIAW